ncbi:histidine kinase dimerization/phospho-acceptor domain-containing protein [Streptantibioticus rubrisoli]|uniref:histidine kinase n=1 Tax=Streptantibioticus rubrisoli TaxID=1387313 RepID=A0ABT1P9K2_9ACTN|nr:HAMP domain-containing sensor histidine kinase [Streptantibioticus rubrisoli]MCQ4042053.1 HAMP domain-containing histidine kinase [Streptantibioticus rubrisoli]
MMRGRRRPRGAPVRAGSLRRRVLVSIVAVTACAVLVFTLPLALTVHRIYRSNAVVTVERNAVWAALSLPVPASTRHGRALLPSSRTPDTHVAIYTTSGHRMDGRGPDFSEVVLQARDGRLHEAVEDDQLAVAAPVSRNGKVVAVVRAWLPWDFVTDRTLGVWLLLAALGAVVVALSAVLARHLARRIAIPLERLTATARALGDGDFSIQPARSGIREADAVGQALSATAERLGQLLERERRFSTAVSHQLRTPLTALILGLERALEQQGPVPRESLTTALRRADQLGRTVEELLHLSRDTHRCAGSVDVGRLLEQAAARHRDAINDAGRSLALRCEPDLPPVRASEVAILQIVDVLLDNALAHGRGEISLVAADVGAGVALEVGDEGPGPAGGGDAAFAVPRQRGHGIGLALARSLAEAEGGRLVLRRPGPGPVFALLLPA